MVTWAEPDVWDQDKNTPIDVKPVTQNIAFGRKFAKVAVYDPLVGTDPINSVVNASSVDVGVTDHPLLVRLSD